MSNKISKYSSKTLRRKLINRSKMENDVPLGIQEPYINQTEKDISLNFYPVLGSDIRNMSDMKDIINLKEVSDDDVYLMVNVVDRFKLFDLNKFGVVGFQIYFSGLKSKKEIIDNNNKLNNNILSYVGKNLNKTNFLDSSDEELINSENFKTYQVFLINPLISYMISYVSTSNNIYYKSDVGSDDFNIKFIMGTTFGGFLNSIFSQGSNKNLNLNDMFSNLVNNNKGNKNYFVFGIIKNVFTDSKKSICITDIILSDKLGNDLKNKYNIVGMCNKDFY